MNFFDFSPFFSNFFLNFFHFFLKFLRLPLFLFFDFLPFYLWFFSFDFLAWIYLNSKREKMWALLKNLGSRKKILFCSSDWYRYATLFYSPYHHHYIFPPWCYNTVLSLLLPNHKWARFGQLRATKKIEKKAKRKSKNLLEKKHVFQNIFTHFIPSKKVAYFFRSPQFSCF